MAKRGRGAELNALRQKKKDEETGSTKQKSQSSVSSNKNGGGRTGGLTRQQVQQKVSRSAGYTSSGKAKQPAQTQKTNPYATTRNIINRDTPNVPERASRTNNRINSSNTRGREQTPINRRQTFATAVEMRRAQENERLSRTSTGRKMLEQRKAENKAKAQTAEEWKDVKKLSTAEQQEWFTKKAQDAQERNALKNNTKVDKGTDNLATSAFKAMGLGAKSAGSSLLGRLERGSLNDTYESAKFKFDAMREGKSESEAQAIGDSKAQQRQEQRLAGLRAITKAAQERTEQIQEEEEAKDQHKINIGGETFSPRKMAVGAASFTGQRITDTVAMGPYSLLGMGARVLEDETNSGKEKADRLKKRLADSGQFSQEELDREFDKIDRRTTANAYASAGIEMLSELMFSGVGLSKKYLPEGATGLLDRTIGKLFGNIERSAVGRVALGIGEETAEEWIANPIQAAISNKLTGNRLQGLQEESIRRAYQGQAQSLKEAHATAADINSQAFLDRAKEVYKESGANEEEATRIAELARDYFNADLTGDSETAQQKLQQITDILAGGENDLRDKWTLRDALEVAGEMVLSVGAEATPGAISTAQTGGQYKANYGIEGVRKLAKVVENLDTDKTHQAAAIVDDIDKGKDISNTQVAMLMEWSNAAAQKAQDREITRDQVVQRKMRDERLFVPIVDSEYNLAPATAERFESITERVADLAQDYMGVKMSDRDAYAIGDVVAAYQTGTISAEQMNEINMENPENRAVFERATGINLDQYTVKDSQGNVNVAASNTAMQEDLFAKAADNYMKSARLEQENWNDVARGQAYEELTSNMDGMGGVGIQRVLESVDPRNRDDFMLAGSVARRVYEHARATNDDWNTVKRDFTQAFGADMNESMKYVFDMAKQAKAIAENKYYGKQVSPKSSIGDTVVAEGKFTNESARELKGSEIGVLASIASELGIDAIMTDALDRGENGRYMSGKRTIMLNAANTMGENLEAIFSHEVTHHLAAYAPEEYIKLSRFVMDRWYKANPDEYNAEIKRIQKLYKDAKNQELSPEEALEELIADGSRDFWQDGELINSVTTEEPSLAKSIINAIKSFLGKLRNILASGNITDENIREGFFAEIDAYDEAYRLWLNAYKAARSDSARQAIDEWQDKVFEETRHSISETDSDYMDAVNRGDMETAQRMVDEAAAEAMPNTKLKGRWYHGTENEFTEFNFSQGGKNGHADGYGIYLTNDPEVASSYGTRMIEGYVNVERPASALDTTTLTNDEMHRLIARTVNEEAERLLEEGYDNLGEAKFDTWISNYTDTRYAGDIDKAIDEVIDSITNINGNDYDIVLEIMTGMGIRDYDEASKFYDILTEETGIDGFETKWGDESEMADPNTPTIALAFRSNQIKDASPVTYDDAGNVIPLSERFNAENNDIRYSFTTDQEDLIKNGEIPKSLRDWAKEIGLDEISKQPTKGPVEVSVKSLRSAWFQKDGREDEAEVVNTVLDTIGKSLTNMIGKYNYIDLGDAVNASVHYRTDKDGKPVSVILTCQVKNAEYEVNFDFTTICSKRLAMQRVLERFIKTEGESKGTLYDELKLDEEGMYKLRLILEKAGFEVSCKGCFVEQNRYSQQGQAKTIADDWNKAIDEWEKEHNEKITENFDLVNMDINALDYDEIQEAFNNYSDLMAGRDTNVETKNRTLIEAHPFFRKRMNPSDYASMAGQRALMAIGVKQFRTKDGKSKKGTTLYGLLKRGQSDSKQSVPFTAYNGEISLLPDKMKGRDLADYLMSIGGARAQSASDFQIEFFYDYMQLVADLSARGLPMHMYTKVIELAELFGMTGVKINLSAMCDVDESLGGEYAGLKLVDGEYVYNISDQSIDYDKAVELQKKPGYSKNIGIIMVALSKQHMLKSLDDPDVRYIIGYHSSSMPAVVAQMTNMGNATDYTKLNKTNKLNDKGKALFAKAMEQAKGKTKLAKYKDALRIFDDMIQEEVANSGGKIPRRGNEYARYMSAYGGNTAEFNTYDDLKKSNDARKTADNYIEWCMKNDLVPIYFPFAFHENYYKCEIYDFNMYDNVSGEYAPMEAVQNIYPGLDMTKGETDTTAFMDTVTGMMDERNDINRDLDSMYDNVFDEAKEELKFSISGDEYMDFDEAGIDRTELTPRADATKTEDQLRDEAYMDAYFDGDDDAMQELVDEAAKKAGYGTRLYHGTQDFGFTRIVTSDLESNSDGGYYDWSPFFATDSLDVAQTYSSTNDIKRISEAEEPFDEYAFEDDYYDAVSDAISAVNEFAETYNYLDYDANPFRKAYEELQNSSYPIGQIIEGLEDEIGEMISEIAWQKAGDESEDRFGDISDLADEIQESEAANRIWEELGVVASKLRQYDRAVYGDSFSGNYDLFANTDNLMEVDAKGKRWNNISYNRYAAEDTELTPYEEIFGATDDTTYNTRQLARIAREQGYPGIKISNVFDDGGKGRRQQVPATVYIFFEPEKQIKSADPVTYADDGSVIPLSERFDPNNNDIRYSLPTQDSDGNVLTDGQMEYFKNSQARDEQGRLVPVYHTTNKGGFTVFDPSYSDDRRSLFFASNFDVSQTYGRNANKPIEFLSDDEQQLADEFPFIAGDEIETKQERQRGYYSCYLNLENPLVVDAQGASWNRIPYGSVEENPVRRETLNRMEAEAEYIINSITAEWDDFDDDFKYGDYSGDYRTLKLVISGSRRNDVGGLEAWTENKTFTADEENWAGENGEYTSPNEKLSYDLVHYWESLGLSMDYYEEVMNTIDSMDGSVDYEAITHNQEWAPDYITSDGYKMYYPEIFDEVNEELDMDYAPYEGIHAGTYKTRQLAKLAQDSGYDGVVIRNCYDIGALSHLKNGASALSDIFIAFSSNQVKDTRNENPTENPDIRYSIPPEDETMNYAQTNAETTDNLWYTDPVMHEGAIRYSMSKKDFINGTTDKWNPAWKTEGRVLKEKSVEKDIRNVIMGAMRNSDTSAKYRQKVVKDTMLVARKAFDYMKSDEHTKAAALLYDHAHSIIENLEFFGNQDESEFQRYKELKEYLRTTKITVPEDKRSDIDYEAFRRNNFHKILLGDGGIAPDKVWGPLNELWPEAFSEDIKGDIPGIMLQIENALDIYKPYAEAYSSEQCEEFAGDIANSLWDIIYEGEEYKSLADKYDDKAKAMKLRHQEAMRKVKENYKEKLTKQALDAKRKQYAMLDRQKERYEEKLDQQKARLNARQGKALGKQKARYEKEISRLKENRKNADAKRRARREHRTLYDRILKEYKDLTHRLLNPSKDKTKNIPEQLRQPLAQMLYCFDLEKERSKKLEEMYMIPTRSQLNFRQLKDAMEQVVKEDPTAYEMSDIHKYLKDKMTDLADRVDGKSIDALDEADMQIVKDLLSGLNKAIKDGQQLEIDGENYQKQVQCDKVGEGAAEHQKIYGKAKTYDGARKIVDNILNMGELTPIYFFKGIPGMYDMYRQLRTGFDEYVRNENEIIDKIADILAPYYKTNRKGQRVQGSEIEDWRHAESAETFDLISGDQTITLTIAQRMALYCLAKRSHAQGHMYSENGGIVASEITAGSKITKAKESVKGKIVEQKPVVLTPADVDNIIASLTDDQVKIAEQLQDLMSKDMSVLGNKASMKLTGIEMYKEDNYFPIKVQGDSRPTDIDNIGIREKIRNPGFSNPLIENAQNPIIVDDIFTVVASHCNEMNQYASYAVPITSFMKVYNGSVLDENNKPVKIKTLIRQTYGDKAITYIENFIDDINGNSFKRQGGLDDVLDKALGQAKKAAVFANLRVALQQPTAIVRAFAALDPKYFKGVKPSPKATQEMIEHCPIAQWKAWGYYDTHFGRDIEDVMMGKNVPNKMDYFMSEIYGALDNMTWGMIWQAVKNEVKTTNKGIDENSQEFWDLCNERASYVFDTTQVVDSPFHRSNDMRSKNGLVKQLTSFQAEPTLSFNVLRQGLVDAIEASKTGNNSKARKVILKTLTVWTVQALTVALAQSFVDALRRKGKKDEDDDKDEMLTWYQEIAKYFLRNFGNNLADDMNPINNVYFFKDIVPPILNAIKGEYVFGQQNLTFQWVDSLTTGIEHCRMKWEKGDAYSKSWYDCISELLGGLGYFAGVPAKTMMRGVKNAWHWFNKVTGANVFADDGSVVDSTVESVVSRFRGSGGSSGSESSGTKTGSSEGGTGEPNTTREERDKAIRKEADQIKGSVADKTGEEREKATWKKVTDFIKENEGKSVEELVASGDYDTLNKYRVMYVYAGNTKDYFDQRIFDESKSAMKKSILYDPTEQQTMAQQNIKDYLTANGMSEADLSEIAYKSETKKDLAVACRIGDEDAMVESLVPLIRAGLTYEDFVKIYDNRNRVDLKKYKDKGGRYASKLKSMGTFIWPTEGVITSHFGYRNSPTAGASSNHPAIDIGASQGTPVVAADGGVVIYAGNNGGYGNSVGIKHDNGMVTYYNHLYAWNVKVGDTVGQGQQIAQVGSTGISTGPHLDFKILDKNGKPVDPEKYLN